MVRAVPRGGPRELAHDAVWPHHPHDDIKSRSLGNPIRQPWRPCQSTKRWRHTHVSH